MKLIRNIANRSDEELMERFIKRSDEKALEVLYERYAPKLMGYFYKIFDGDEAKAKDFLQDLFVKVIEKKEQFDTRRRFYTWVFTIASNMAKSSFRKPLLYKVDNSEDVLSVIKVEETNNMDQQVFRRELRKQIHDLESHHKIVFILRYQEGFSLKEVAEIAEVSLGTVKSRLFYATKLLGERMKHLELEYIDNIKMRNNG